MILVDSNVLLDVVTDDAQWRSWSAAALSDAVLTGTVAINQLVYAEVSIAYRRVQELDAVLNRLRIQRADLPWEAAHLAGQAFLSYRRSDGQKSSPMPDFYIGAHAQTLGAQLLTRDVRRYRTYFPDVSLIAPD
ncbi:type II toxin-antitoxin system VapC family toxin [Spiribacter onubensis]|uniref:Type II toxin-antitoxin system VapC family toxin n=1 Tax=Spiribacter onubensis TaxID=3122420 RepID=A0ABV3SB64_9GAMM